MILIVVLIIIALIIAIKVISRTDKSDHSKTFQSYVNTARAEDKPIQSSNPYDTPISTDFSNNKVQNNMSEELSLSEIIERSKFVAIDFETANNEISSACSLGLAFSDGNKVIATKHYYIKPTPNHFDPENIKIHGITPEMVKDAPTFFDLWMEIDSIDMLDFVAHNAEFDANVLRQAYQASAPDPRFQVSSVIQFFCTRNIARNAYDLSSYKLDEVCKYLGVNLTNHHDATADAVAAAEIIHAMIKKSGIICLKYSPLYDIADMCEYNPVTLGEIRHMKPFGAAKRIKEYDKQR